MINIIKENSITKSKLYDADKNLSDTNTEEDLTLDAEILVDTESSNANKNHFIGSFAGLKISPLLREEKDINENTSLVDSLKNQLLKESLESKRKSYFVFKTNAVNYFDECVNTRFDEQVKSIPTQLAYNENNLWLHFNSKTNYFLQEFYDCKNLATSEFEENHNKAIARVNNLCQNPTDEYPPNLISQEAALETLNLLRSYNIVPSLINSTDDESLLFEFFSEKISYSIEFHNSGEIYYLRKAKGDVGFIFEIDKEQLREFTSEISSIYARNNM
jgi:hypothetical protein